MAPAPLAFAKSEDDMPGFAAAYLANTLDIFATSTLSVLLAPAVASLLPSIDVGEPRRVSRRLQRLREWSHGDEENGEALSGGAA